MIKKNKNCLEENFDFKKNVSKKERCSEYFGTITLWKEVGETPLEVVEKFKEENPKYKNIKFAYAGRLDPMAEGKLLVLVGDTCKEREKYLNLDKEYEFEILCGFKSDTKDILGLAKKNMGWRTTWIEKKWFNNQLKKYIGKIKLEYPVFSSRTVQNKPLFLWALENRLDEIKIPTKESEIYNLKLISKKKIFGEFLKKEILRKISLPKEVREESKALGKNFRRGEIIPKWEELLKNSKDESFLLLKIRATVSSGTYMRTLAEKIADEVLEDYGLAFSIKRTKIGIFKKIGFLNFWKKLF